MRPPSKLAYAEEFEGDAERRTAAYSNVREDSSTASTYKLPAEVEFRRRSINFSNFWGVSKANIGYRKSIRFIKVTDSNCPW
ncbi:MAG: palindromic element RPE1 domain-containing protein [Rickettsia endosymbiont of Platyusa sonomae]|nr:palindromic element RPE1 domain-containing protein [Rickettsia endosymbiont of Platyusa sonomae]